MRKRMHFLSCEECSAYRTAQHCAMQLKEVAKLNKLCYKTIQVFNKKQVLDRHTGPADAQIFWENGPEDWVYNINIILPDDVCAYVQDDYTISFFNN